MVDTVRHVGESMDDFMIRLAENMNAYGLKWQDVADILNVEGGTTYSESRWRKRFKTFNQGRLYERKHGGNDMLVAQARELEKQKIGLAEQRQAINRAIREDAKRDAVVDDIKRIISEFEPIEFKGNLDITYHSDGTLLVLLTDPHIGMAFSNSRAQYNSDITRERLEQYAARVIREAKLLGVSKCVVALGGDIISGGIHVPLRIENRENLIRQIKLAGEMISQFVATIAPFFSTLTVYGVGGNHSRAYFKDDSLLGELLDNLIPWYMEARLARYLNVRIDTSGDDLAAVVFEVEGLKVGLIHGDHDSLDEKGIAKLADYVDERLDVVLAGHLHENYFGDVLRTHIIQGGCLSGSGDDFTNGKRLSCYPSQMMAHITREHGIEHVIPLYWK